MGNPAATVADEREVGWRFDNTYARLPDTLFVPATPVTVRGPRVSVLNHRLADDLGLDLEAMWSGACAEIPEPKAWGGLPAKEKTQKRAGKLPRKKATKKRPTKTKSKKSSAPAANDEDFDLDEDLGLEDDDE